jgi:hypothetical protein
MSVAAHAADSSAVFERFSKAVENEERNPTKQPPLGDLFAGYSALSYDSKFDAHVRCSTLAHLGERAGLVPKTEADRVAHAHVSALVYGANTPEEKQKLETYEKAIFGAAMIYEVAGKQRAFNDEFPACIKFADSVPAT